MGSSLEVCQGGNYIAEGTQRLVDFLALFQPLACRLGDSDSLASRKIDQIKLPHSYLLGAFLIIVLWSLQQSHLLDNYNENSVRPRGEIVHFGRGCSSALGSLLHEGIDFVRRPDRPLAEPLDKNSFFLVLSDLERVAFGLEKVGNEFVVDLQVAYSDHEGGVLARLHLNEFENFFHAPRNDTSLRVSNFVLEPFHGVGLSCSSLTISKDCSIVALKYRQNTLLCCILVYELLTCSFIIYIVKCKALPDT